MLLQTAPAGPTPLFKTLSHDECEGVLLRNNVGRIAFSVHDRVSIVPVHYVFADGWIYGRTTSAGKLRQILRNRHIAFEVDEYSQQLFDWQSVIVRGPLYVIRPDSMKEVPSARVTIPGARNVYATAVSVIRKLVPDAFTETDPVPFRDQLFRIRAVEVTGRASAPSGGQRQDPELSVPVFEDAQPNEDAELREQVQSAIATLDLPADAEVYVEVFDGVVVLSGAVATLRDRQAIEVAILGIPRVAALVQGLETKLPLGEELLPSELARSAIKELRSEVNVLASGLKVVVEHGWLRIEGKVQSHRQRDEIARRLRSVKGARGVVDCTRVVTNAM